MCWKLPLKRVPYLCGVYQRENQKTLLKFGLASLSHLDPIGRRIVFQASNFQGYGFIVILRDDGLFNNPHLYKCVDYVVFHPLYHQNNQEA